MDEIYEKYQIEVSKQIYFSTILEHCTLAEKAELFT